jgi:nicotinamide-nucleotide amidase
MATPENLIARAPGLLDAYRAKKAKIATAESCTGGLIAAMLTEIPGSSDVVDRGFVTYSNGAKTDLLGVEESLLAAHGAVSAEVASAMVRGALARSAADVAVAVTGIAGPGGATANKPVGLVYLACVGRSKPLTLARHIFSGDRAAVRLATVDRAFDLLEQAIQD